MGVELGLTLQDNLGEDIPVTLISEALSIREIAHRITQHLHGETDSAALSSDDARLVLQHMSISPDQVPQLEAAAE